MRKILPEIAKAAAKFFLFGAILALSAPYIGAVGGLSPTVEAASADMGKFADPWLLGAFFAAIGVLDAVLKPLFKKLFSEKPPSAS